MWTNELVNILGVWVSTNENELENLNYEDLLSKVPNILQCWQNRNLSLFGKILIINSLIGSLFVYKMQVLPLMSKNLIQKFENEISRFL